MIPVHTRFDVGSSAIFISKHFGELRNLALGRNDERNHRSSIAVNKNAT
jgi:hypothetical protein